MSPVAFVDANVPIYAAGRAHPFFWVGPGSRPGQGWIGLACGLSSDTGTGPPTGVTRGIRSSPLGRRHLWLMIFLSFLFTLRVAAQLVQAVHEAPFLPPFEAWQGSGIPYPALLGLQAGIIAVLVFVLRLVYAGATAPPSLETPNLFCGGQRISGCNGVPPCLRPNIPGGIRLVCEEYSGPVPRYPSFAYPESTDGHGWTA